MTTATSIAGSGGKSKLGAVLRVTSGNFLEQFDFFLFGFYASFIAKTFFPSSSEFLSLMFAFGVFAPDFSSTSCAIILGVHRQGRGVERG